MSSRLPDPDLKRLWQNMETEGAVSLRQIEMKAQQTMSRNRRDLLARSAFAVAAAAFCGLVLVTVRNPSIAVIAGLVTVMLLVSTVGRLIAFYQRSAAGAPWSTCLDFYRAELERQRQTASQPVWQLVAALLIIGWLSQRMVMRASSGVLDVLLPVVLIAAAGLVVLMAVRKFGARRIQADIEALNRFEEENPRGGVDDPFKG